LRAWVTIYKNVVALDGPGPAQKHTEAVLDRITSLTKDVYEAAETQHHHATFEALYGHSATQLRVTVVQQQCKTVADTTEQFTQEWIDFDKAVSARAPRMPTLLQATNDIVSGVKNYLLASERELQTVCAQLGTHPRAIRRSTVMFDITTAHLRQFVSQRSSSTVYLIAPLCISVLDGHVRTVEALLCVITSATGGGLASSTSSAQSDLAEKVTSVDDMLRSCSEHPMMGNLRETIAKAARSIAKLLAEKAARESPRT
jgi:hypothetical protein